MALAALHSHYWSGAKKLQWGMGFFGPFGSFFAVFLRTLYEGVRHG